MIVHTYFIVTDILIWRCQTWWYYLMHTHTYLAFKYIIKLWTYLLIKICVTTIFCRIEQLSNWLPTYLHIFKMKTLAIFGATGQTGLHLVAQALFKGGVISEDIFNFKKMNQLPTFYFILIRGIVMWFIFWGWDKISKLKIPKFKISKFKISKFKVYQNWRYLLRLSNL